jgi:hypothetical protein
LQLVSDIRPSYKFEFAMIGLANFYAHNIQVFACPKCKKSFPCFPWNPDPMMAAAVYEICRKKALITPEELISIWSCLLTKIEKSADFCAKIGFEHYSLFESPDREPVEVQIEKAMAGRPIDLHAAQEDLIVAGQMKREINILLAKYVGFENWQGVDKVRTEDITWARDQKLRDLFTEFVSADPRWDSYSVDKGDTLEIHVIHEPV